jgi:hypothetical protein
MRAEGMRSDVEQRRMAKSIAAFWETVWRARPRVFRCI